MRTQPTLTRFELETERMVLVPIERRWADEIFREFTPTITKYMYPQAAASIDETLSFIDSSRAGLERGDNLQLVILRRDTEEFLGCLGLHGLETRTPEVGLWTKQTAHGQGLGREAASALIRWARENLEFDHLTYPVDKRNRGSRRIAEENGGVVAREYKQVNLAGFELDQVEYHLAP